MLPIYYLRCPHCDSTAIIQIHRSWWERLFYRAKKYRCEQCRRTFHAR